MASPEPYLAMILRLASIKAGMTLAELNSVQQIKVISPVVHVDDWTHAAHNTSLCNNTAGLA
jgi:hypothetical protein